MSLAERVRADRAAQGLPPRVTDRGVLAKVAALILASQNEARGHRAPGFQSCASSTDQESDGGDRT